MLLARALVLSALSLSPLCAQTTIHVPGDAATIQGGIALAQDGDTVLVAPGTYFETIDFLGKAITVRSSGGAAATTIDAQSFNPVVGFVTGEGDDSVLRGFTVTGGVSGGGAGGIHCYDGQPTKPRIQSCVIRGNRNQGVGAGVFGSPTLEDCVIENNIGGGVAGAPTLRRCIVRNNSDYDASGLLLFGGTVEDTLIIGNHSGEGSYGGAVSIHGPGVTLRGCTIAGNDENTSGAYASYGTAVQISSSDPALLVNCTIVGNRIVVPSFYGGDVGGIAGPGRLVNTIVRDNDADELSPFGGATAVYSDIQGGYPGLGNFDADPLFRDAPGGDYRLLPGSPCIDTGAPTAPLDADGTRADVGAFAFAHAVATVRNGRGVNPLLLASVTPPAIGTTWQATIDASLVPGTTLSGISARANALDPGILIAAGELLISGPRLGTMTQPSNGVSDSFSVPIPNDLGLLGVEVQAQGFVRAPGGLRLGNALRLLLGE